MPDTGPPTILFEVFWTQQKRLRELVRPIYARLRLLPESVVEVES